MACFVVPGVEAIVVTAITAAQKKKEKASAEAHVTVDTAKSIPEEAGSKIPLTRKLTWLKAMLWGGVILLAFEHIWHGEVVPYPPFLTAMHSPATASAMFREMATTGVIMAVLVTLTWVVICLVADAVSKRSAATEETAK